MIAVSIRCPVCSELITMNFKDNEMVDPAFAEIIDEQPWVVICTDCGNDFKKNFKDHDACMEFHELILCDWHQAAELARNYIQQT